MAHQSITQAFVIAWDEAIRHAAQQSESRLLGTVINKGNVEGESFTHNYLGTTEMDEVVDRLGDTEWGAVEHKTPIALIRDFYKALPLDKFDIPKMKVNPVAGGDYMSTLIKAKNRKVDDIIYQAGLRAQGFKDGSTEALPVTQIITDSGAGMTKAKLIQARKIFRRNECDEHAGEELCFLYDDNILEDILADTTLTNADFMAVKMLQSGDVSGKWMGFNWIPYNSFNQSGTVRSSMAYTKTAIKFATGDEEGDVTRRADKRNAWQVSYAISMEAMRTDAMKVVKVDYQV